MVVLSERLWRTRFNGDPSIVGKGVVLSGESFTVIGVMPAGIQHVEEILTTPAHGETVDLWWPLALLPHDAAGCDRGCHYLNMVARLAPGVSAAQAAAAMNSVSAQLAKEHPDNAHQISVIPLKEEVVGAGAADALRAARRGGISAVDRLRKRGEFIAGASDHTATGIRVAFSAGRGEFPDFAATADGKFGASIFGLRAATVVFAIWGVDALIALGPEQLPRLQAVHMDARVLGFAALITVLTSVIFGLAPSLATLRTDVNQTLKDGDRGTTPASRTRRIAECAGDRGNMPGACAAGRRGIADAHVYQSAARERGIQPEHVLTLAPDLPSKRYPDDATSIRFYKTLVERLKTLPGVAIGGRFV